MLFRDQDLRLENRVDANSIALFCAPAINLFERRLDRIPLDHRHHEYQVIPDKTRPFDFEGFDIQSVIGYGAQTGEEQPFLPFYLTRERLSEQMPGASSQLRGFGTTSAGGEAPDGQRTPVWPSPFLYRLRRLSFARRPLFGAL